MDKPTPAFSLRSQSGRGADHSVSPEAGDSEFQALLDIWFPEKKPLPTAFLVDTSEEALLLPDWLKLRMIRSEVPRLVDAGTARGGGTAQGGEQPRDGDTGTAGGGMARGGGCRYCWGGGDSPGWGGHWYGPGGARPRFSLQAVAKERGQLGGLWQVLGRPLFGSYLDPSGS